MEKELRELEVQECKHEVAALEAKAELEGDDPYGELMALEVAASELEGSYLEKPWTHIHGYESLRGMDLNLALMGWTVFFPVLYYRINLNQIRGIYNRTR